MRPSMAPGSRASHAAPAAMQQPSAAQLAKLLEKKKEFEAVSALERASATLVKRIEGLGDDCDIMADAGEGMDDISQRLLPMKLNVAQYMVK